MVPASGQADVCTNTSNEIGSSGSGVEGSAVVGSGVVDSSVVGSAIVDSAVVLAMLGPEVSI